MKAIFNIAENIRDSRSISALSALRKLQSLGLLLCALLFGSLQVWGAEKEWDFSTDGLSSKTPITLTYGIGEASNNTTVSSGTLRLYAKRSNGKGSWIKFEAASGYEITAVSVTAADNQSYARYAVDPASMTGAFSNSFTFVSGTATVSSLHATSFAIRNGQNSGSQNKTIQISSITITYAATASGYAVTYNNGEHGTAPSSTTASNVTLSAITGVTGYTCTGWKANVDVKNTSTSATITAGTLISNGTNVTLLTATTFTAQWEVTKYTVTFAVNVAGYGSVSQATVTNVPHGTIPTSSSNTVTVNGTTVTATPHAQDADYNYVFSSWSGIPASVTSAVTITANFTRTARTLTNYRTSCSDPSCDEPTALETSSVTSTSVGLTITDPADAGAYEIYFNMSGVAPSSGTGASATYNTLTPTVTGLASGATYYMWVRAKCDESTKSNWVALTSTTVTTTCGDPTPSAPSSIIDATTGQNGGVTLSWTGDPNNYELYWHQSNTKPDAGQSPSQSVDGAKTYNVTGLTAGTYYWWVRSNCGSGKGPWVAGTSFTIKGIKVGGTTPVNFGTVNQNSLVEDKFITVTGVGLASGTNITATMSSGSPFSLDPTSVDYDASGTHVNISASTATAGTFNQTLTLSYGGTYTATVTVMMTVQAVYTVTYVHHDKGTFSGASTTQYVPTNATTITLPTVTDVSCGFYDTFEGWIASGSEYSESTSKPATVYAGGSSYTVTGDVTLRALYSKCEGDGGQLYRKVTAIGDVTNDGTYILVGNSATPTVYSGHSGSNDYGDCITGLTADGDDYSSTLPSGAVQVTATRGTGDNVNYFSLYNGSKYIVAGTSTGTSNDPSWWKLTDGSNVYSKSCPANVLQPSSQSTYVLQKNNSYNRFKTYTNSQSSYVFLYKLIDKCTRYYATDPSCVKPVGVHIVYNANAGDATMDCSTSNRTYKVVSGDNKYPQLASSYSFCTNATRTGYTLVGWNTRADGLGTTYDIDHSYSNLPVSGELDGENWVTLNVYAMWASAVSFNLGNATGGTGVPAVVEEDGGYMLPEPTAAQIGTIPCGYSFYGWSENSVGATQTKPTLFMPGTKYTGASRTLYAVYRLAGEGGNPDLFSLSYTYSDTKYYVAASSAVTTAPSTWDYPYTKGGKFAASTNAEDAIAFGMKTNADHPEHKEIYWVYEGDEDEKIYLQYSSGASVQFNSQEDTYYQRWTVTGTNVLTFLNYSSSRYLSGDNTEIGCPSSPDTYTFTKEEASTTTYTYATNPSCETTATLQFVTNGGTLNYPDTYDASNYVDLTVGTNVYLPTATYAGEWVFEGWMKGAPVTDTEMRPESVNFIEVTLNTTTYSAAPAGTTTFYAVYSKTINDKQFDPVNGGTYKLFAIMADGTTKNYMPVWDGSQTTLDEVTSCAATGDYTITPGTGEHEGQYKITHGSYTLGVRSDGDTQFKNVADAWWDIESSSSGKGTWRIKIHGSSNRCMAFAGTGFFSNTIISNFVDNPSQPGYRDMEIGECIYTEYTSTPENIPYITITGSPVKITSTNGERVYAPTKIHIEAHNFTGTRRINFSATNGFATNPAFVNCEANGSYSGDIDIYYQPTTGGDGSIVTSVLTASQAAESVTQTFSAISGRNMPANFVIAVKSGSQWYALPDDCHSSGTPKAVPIEVNDPNAPTAASLVPHNVEWRLSDVVNSNSRPKDKVYFYEPNSTNNYTLYAGSAPNIQTNAQLSNVTGENSYTYEWGLTTSDLCAYTIGNANVGKNISINNAGNFGAHASGIVSSTLYLLPITAYYETAAMQVLEWKANSVVVMYTGTQTTATTTVGDNSASGSQTLASQKLTHGIYELTTGQALTDNAGQTLKVSFGGSAEIAFVTIPIIINNDVTADADHASEDVIIVSGGKLTAAATKYSFHNIYVYGGGKLKIASGSQLGVNNIILRAGGVTTNGSGGSATYAYTYPQLELGGTLTSTQTNIKYEYITDYDHWYHLVLPFDGTLSSITYPQEYYGDNVTAANTGSWVIKRYAGEVRATGNYDAWKDIETEGETSVTAGYGYIFWGAPKKVSVGGAAKQRQQWGIQRITMPITAAAATTAETADKNISVDSYSDVEGKSTKPNDQGWNLVGNPYMVNLTNLSSESMIAGELVHTETVPWDGKWRNNGDDIRYVTIPDNHFDNYKAKTASVAAGAGDFMPGRAFFVQIAEGASTLTFAAANRASLTPARFAQTAQSVDIETGIVMSDESKHDEVNFWIKEDKTAEYEYNADYPKTPNNTNFNIYGVHSHGDLSWIAISPEIAEGSMAIGYQVPTAGEYRLSLSETYVSDKIDQLLVTDHEMSPEITTNLLVEDYVFQVNQAETNNTRFTVSIHLAPQTPTDIGNVPSEGMNAANAKPQKFIYHDKLYILRNGVIYDATGKKVKGGLK